MGFCPLDQSVMSGIVHDREYVHITNSNGTAVRRHTNGLYGSMYRLYDTTQLSLSQTSHVNQTAILSVVSPVVDSRRHFFRIYRMIYVYI